MYNSSNAINTLGKKIRIAAVILDPVSTQEL